MTDVPAPVRLQLNPPQMAALVLVESRIVALEHEASVYVAMGAPPLAQAAKSAAEALRTAHAAYLAETQRAVKLVAPTDLQTALQNAVRP